MNIESVTVVIVADSKALVIQPTPAQISAIDWSQQRTEFDGTGTFTLRIDGERAAVNGTRVDKNKAPVVIPADDMRAILTVAAKYVGRASGGVRGDDEKTVWRYLLSNRWLPGPTE